LLAASAARGQDVTGRWRGEWTDFDSGHRGPLRAKVKPTADGGYRAVFTGRYYAVIPFRFGAKLEPVGTTESGELLMQGTQRLPFFGAFSYVAVSDGSTFTADYSARRWTGRFSLRR
jgi:hypothetical protein